MHTNPIAVARSGRRSHPVQAGARNLDPGHIGPGSSLPASPPLEGRAQRACEHVERALALSPDGDQTLAVRALRSWLADDAAEQRDVLVATAVGPGGRRSYRLLRRGGVRWRLARAERFGASLTGIIESEDLRAVSWLVRAYVAFARGQVGSGLDMLREQRMVQPTLARELAALIVAGSVFPAECVPLARCAPRWPRGRRARTGRAISPCSRCTTDCMRTCGSICSASSMRRLDRPNEASASAEALAEEPVSARRRRSSRTCCAT